MNRKNTVYVEQPYLIFPQNRHRYKTRVCSLSQFIYFIYCSYLSHLQKRPKNLFQNLAFSFLSFVDDSLFISQEKSFERSNIILFCSYNIITSFFDQVQLTVKHRKLEIFYFFTLSRNFNPFFWILLIEMTLFFNWRILENILALSLTENSSFVNISVLILTKPFLQSKIWKC